MDSDGISDGCNFGEHYVSNLSLIDKRRYSNNNTVTRDEINLLSSQTLLIWSIKTK